MAARPRTQEPDTTLYSGRMALRLRKLRESAKLSVADLAKDMTAAGYKISAPTIWHWEGGNRQPQLDAIPYLAKCLKCRIGDLFPVR